MACSVLLLILDVRKILPCHLSHIGKMCSLMHFLGWLMAVIIKKQTAVEKSANGMWIINMILPA